MIRRHLPRLAGAAATVAALVVAMTAIAGTGFAQDNNAAQASYAPSNTAAPAISGTPQVGQTLTAGQGSWTSDTTPTFAYQWQRCNAQGAACAAVSGATAQTYAVQTADKGSTLLVVVTGTNTTGSTSSTSNPTAVVTDAASGGGTGQTSIAASDATRLVIDRVQFNPRRLTSSAAFTGRFHVSDTRGVTVHDALVKVTGLPYSWARNGAEERTDASGWATITLAPTVNLPLHKRAALVMFVRARTEGQPLLAGNSSRRLVQVTVR